MIRCILFFLITICFSSGTWTANDIAGTWINTDKDGHIKIFSSYGKYYGQIIWMKFPNDSLTGKPQLDIHNKNPELRSRPIMKLIILSDLVFDAEAQEWKDGRIYNPKTGTYYDMYCTMKDKNTLEMHFYLGLRSLGQLFYWTRMPE
jgi:uncharacterized protein (DUF2147 family)